MGTNYYLRTKCCDKCKRYDKIHIGKSFVGWPFVFEGTKYKTIRAWKKHIDNKANEIYDEYGRRQIKNEFWELVEIKKDEKAWKNDCGDEEPWSWLDRGYWFNDYEFS
jgi:hypothetical protein